VHWIQLNFYVTRDRCLHCEHHQLRRCGELRESIMYFHVTGRVPQIFKILPYKWVTLHALPVFEGKTFYAFQWTCGGVDLGFKMLFRSRIGISFLRLIPPMPNPLTESPSSWLLIGSMKLQMSKEMIFDLLILAQVDLGKQNYGRWIDNLQYFPSVLVVTIKFI